jgi:hypothetical protein
MAESMVAFETPVFSTPFRDFRRSHCSHGWSCLAAAPNARRGVLHMISVCMAVMAGLHDLCARAWSLLSARCVDLRALSVICARSRFDVRNGARWPRFAIVAVLTAHVAFSLITCYSSYLAGLSACPDLHLWAFRQGEPARSTAQWVL